MVKNLILSKVKEYLALKDIKTSKAGKMIMFPCPYCNETANTIPNSINLNCLSCKKRFTLIDIVRKLENREDSEDKIIEYLKEILKIEGVTTEKEENKLDELLDFYEKNKWSLMALSPNTKIPIEGSTEWEKKEYRNKEEHKQWLDNGLNLATRTGSVSNITVLDIDGLNGADKKEFRFGKISENRKKELLNKRKIGLDKVKSKIKDIIGNPLIQENLGGEQLIYQYDSDLPKKKVNIEGIRIDIENNGGYIVIPPSKLGITARKFKELKDIPQIPIKLKEFLLEEIEKEKKKKVEVDETGREIIINNPMPLVEPGGLGRSNVLMKMIGIYRPQFNEKDTKRITRTFNKNFCNPPISDEVLNKTVFASMEKYNDFDEALLSHEILKHIKEVNEITKSDLELSIAGEWTKGEAKKRFNKALQYLIKEEKIIQRGKKIIIIEDLPWSRTLLDVGIPIDFKMPYLNDYAYFNWTDVIVIASKTKYGKTTLAMNIIKRLIAQKLDPWYIYSETGGRFAKTILTLGIREDQFSHAELFDCRKLKLPTSMKRPIIIYDWFRPTDFAKTDALFAELVEKVKKVDGFLIVFMQLKDDNSYFAKNLMTQYPTLVCKYMYENDNNGTYTKFHITENRDSKIQAKQIEIPCVYDWKTKEVKLVEEFDEKEQEQLRRKLEKEKEKK